MYVVFDAFLFFMIYKSYQSNLNYILWCSVLFMLRRNCEYFTVFSGLDTPREEVSKITAQNIIVMLRVYVWCSYLILFMISDKLLLLLPSIVISTLAAIRYFPNWWEQTDELMNQTDDEVALVQRYVWSIWGIVIVSTLFLIQVEGQLKRKLFEQVDQLKSQKFEMTTIFNQLDEAILIL